MHLQEVEVKFRHFKDQILFIGLAPRRSHTHPFLCPKKFMFEKVYVRKSLCSKKFMFEIFCQSIFWPLKQGRGLIKLPSSWDDHKH